MIHLKHFGLQMRQCISILFLVILCNAAFAQHSDDNSTTKQLMVYQDSLTALGKKFINNDTEMERMNANTEFIKTLVKALKVSHSFDFPFDSVKQISHCI